MRGEHCTCRCETENYGEGMVFALLLSVVLSCAVIAHDLLMAKRLRRMVETERAARLELAQELGARAALAAENASLYQHARREAIAREALTAMVSHDLRNPLGVIMTSAAVLTRIAGLEHQSERIRAIGDRIERASTRARRLIDDLLDAASIDAGTLTVATTAHDPAVLVAEAIESQEALTAEKWLRLVSDVEPALPPIECDRERLNQVFANLIGNAVKFSPPGTCITVRARRGNAQADEVVFEVSDQGPGIPADVRQHVFEKYWHRTDDNPAGRGLGLSIARGLVEAHDGRIEVESEPGFGATFRFTIPVADAGAASVSA